MTTEVAARPTDEVLISTLIASHGSMTLAAERLHLPVQEVVDRIPDLPYDRLVSGIKAARLLQAFDQLTIMKDVVINTLPDLTPDRRAKFLIEFMDRFEVMINPPVHGGSGQAGNQTNVFVGGADQLEEARASLASRLVAAGSRASSVQSDGHGDAAGVPIQLESSRSI